MKALYPFKYLGHVGVIFIHLAGQVIKIYHSLTKAKGTLAATANW